MTLRQAHDQAIARWGDRAVAMEERVLGLANRGELVIVCHVGRRGHDSYSWQVLGRGATWEEALAEADRGGTS